VKELIATVHLLPTEEGGRRTPLLSGGLVAVWFGAIAEKSHTKAVNDCRCFLVDRDSVSSGEECDARLQPVAPEMVEHLVRVGLEIEVWEGHRIGQGRITAIL
jgi:hypothetical protein